MSDDVRVPAGWYPDPLGLPQLRWWDNHAWTEHTSDARQPMVAHSMQAQPMQAQPMQAQPMQAAKAETVGPRLAFADDLPFADDLAPVDETLYPVHELNEPTATTGLTVLPSRRELREAERLAHDDDVVRDLAGDAARFGEPLTALEAPSRGGDIAAEPSPAVRYATAARIEDAPRSRRYDLDEHHEDLLGEPSSPRSAFAHANSSSTTFVPDYAPLPDYAANPDNSADARSETARAHGTHRAAHDLAPHTSTVPAWILSLIPVYMLLLGMMVLLSDTEASFAPITVTLLIGVPWLAGIGIAIADVQMLKAGGMIRPATWAWAFLGAPVYLVARLVATVREAGTGLSPVLTFFALGLFMVGSVIAVPGLAMELAPASFSAEAERSVADDARSLGAELTIDCPETPPLLVQQSFACRATDSDGESFDVLVSLQRSNGWIDWRVDDWGVFTTIS